MRMTMRSIVAGIGLSVCAATSVLAQSPEADAPPPGRYTFNRVDGSFLRLDSATGQVAVCSQHTVGWACQAVPEERAALEREIARLQDEVAGLKTEVAGLRAPPPARPPADLSLPGKDSEPGVKLPTREDMERAKAVIDKAWRRLVDMIVDFANDVMRKG